MTFKLIGNVHPVLSIDRPTNAYRMLFSGALKNITQNAGLMELDF